MLNTDEYVRGIDVSRHNVVEGTEDQINLTAAAADGVSFCVIRTTCGMLHDPAADMFFDRCRSANLFTGAYHLLFYNMNIEEQADAFAAECKRLQPSMGAVVDVEKFDSAGVWPEPRMLTDKITRFCDRYIEQTGKIVIPYLSLWTVQNEIWINPTLEKCGVFPAWYTKKLTEQPDVLPWRKWKLWQHSKTGNGKAHGLTSRYVDQDFYNGDSKSFLDHCRRAGFAPLVDPVPMSGLSDHEIVRRLRLLHPEVEDDKAYA
jgi:GH25 family lysozyme M1 (1,4-beta-N-acetylmuramidase)